MQGAPAELVEVYDTAVPAPIRLWTVRAFLICLVLACLIPGLLGAALLIQHDYQASRAALERNSLQTTRALVQAVDSYLFKAQAVAQSLSASDELRHGNVAGLYGESQAFLNMNGLASAISLCDSTGRLIFSTSRELGEPLPMHGNPAQVRKVFETGLPQISNLFTGNVSHKLLISIDVPVLLEGKVHYVLSAALRPEIFDTFLKAQDLPKDWIAAIFDGEGKFVTRTRLPAQFVGKTPSAELARRAVMSREGVFESVTPDGIPVLTIFSRSANTGWFVALGIPRNSLESEYIHPLKLLVAGTVLLFSLGMGLAWWVGERIANSVRALSEQALALGKGEPVLMPVIHVRESNAVAKALVDAARLLRARKQALAAERKGREAELERLVAERTEALQNAIQESERLARCDSLTGLQNRRSANERLREEFQRMQRSGGEYAALLLDIDHFKRINDGYGHEAGDQVLREISRVLIDSVRVTDFVGRFGGEEFLILLPQTDAEGAKTMAEKIRAAVQATRFSAVEQATTSIGISLAIPDDASEDDAVRRADAALYQAKGQGRNRVQIG